ncbi:MAG: LytTR family DNA-binding domain-containing protein [Terricaulis sp.]
MPGAATGEARIALDSARQWLRGLGVAAAAGVFLAVSGAFTGAEVPLLTRLIYWVPVMMLGGVIGRFTSVLVARIPRATANEWVFGALLALVLAVPATFAIWLYTSFFFHMPLTPLTLRYFSGPVLLVSAAMTAIMMMVARPGRVTHAPATSAPAAVRFMERLPPKLKGAVIYAVSAEDHYLRLHTSKGSDLILMRMGDAISELEGLEGAQTHRSWWVAKDAVADVRRDGDKVLLSLKGGAEAPVSRPNVRALREAGWF